MKWRETDESGRVVLHFSVALMRPKNVQPDVPRTPRGG